MRRVERRRFATVQVGAGLAALVVGTALAGCTPTGSRFDLVTSSFQVTSTTDAGLLPAGPAKAAIEGDFVLRNDIFTAVVGGLSAFRQATTSTGMLLDLSLNDGSDQLGFITQSVLGRRTANATTTLTSPGDTPIAWTGVEAVSFTSGPFDGAFGIKCTGLLIDKAITLTTSTFNGASVTTTLPGLTGIPVVTAPNGAPLQIVTTYLARQGDPYLTIETFVTTSDATSTPIEIFSIVDAWRYSDPFATSATTTLITWNPIVGKSSDMVAAGTTQIVVPFVAQFGESPQTFATPASYAHFDDVLGQEIHVFDPDSKTSLTAELNATTQTISLLEPAHWVRKIALGGKNDVASSSDIAIQALGDSAALRGLAPNSIGSVARIQGTVKNPELGMTMLFIEFTPSKIYNPLELLGFVDSPVADPVLQITGLTAKVMTFAEVDSQSGAYSALLPVDFDSRVPVVSPGPGRAYFPGATSALGVAHQYYVVPKLPPTTTSSTDPAVFPAFAGDTVPTFEVK